MSKGFTRKAVKNFLSPSLSCDAVSIDDSPISLLDSFLATRNRPCPDYYKFSDKCYKLFGYDDEEEMEIDLDALIHLSYPRLLPI